MNTILESLANWSSQLWPFLFNHLWQATLFALLVLIASHFVKKVPAKARHAVWLIALVKFALPSTAVFLLAKIIGVDFGAIFSPHTNAVFDSNVPTLTFIAEPVIQNNTGTVASFINFLSAVYVALTIIWLLGSVTFLALWCKRRIQLSRAIMAGRTVFAGREAEALKRVKTWLLIDRDVDLILSSCVNEPGVWRVWNPVIVLPVGIAEHLSEAELETVIMHELFHVTRRDNLFGNLQMILCSLFWFHPMVWLIDRKLLAERERACDEAVVDHSGTSLIYASGILKICRMGLTPGWKVAGVSGVTGSNLETRIEHIMKNTTSGKLKTAHWMLVGGLTAAALCLSLGAGIFSRTSVSAHSSQGNRIASDDYSQVYLTGQPVEVPIHFRNPNRFDAEIPFLFSDARAEVTRMEPAAASNDTELLTASNQYRIRMKVSLQNNWKQPLTGLGVYLTNERSTWSVYIEQVNLSIEPFSQFEFERTVMVTLPKETSLGSLYIEAAAGESEGRHGWGHLSPQPPPPPPPPPMPPAAGRTPAVPPSPPPPPLRLDSDGVETYYGPGAARGGVPSGIPRGAPSGIRGGIPGGVPGGIPIGSVRLIGVDGSVSFVMRPEYTPEARRNRTQGDVRLRVFIAADGTVEKAEITQGLPDGLNEQAIKCVQKMKFSKGERRWLNMRIVFSLADN